MLYRVKQNDTPTKIAARFGVPMRSLLGANPRKPTTVVAGIPTWRSLAVGETVSVPAGVGVGFVGSTASDAVSALVAAGSPCLQSNVALVCAAQAALGVGADGKWGSGSATAAQKLVPGAPAGCSPRPAWWAPSGQSNCVGAAPTAAAATGGAVGVTAAAAAAAAALAADPNYCKSVAVPGTLVNTTVHNFKAAWNAVNPSQAVPIGTGKYEPVTAAALSSALGGQTVAPGCGAAPSAPAPSITPAFVAPSSPAVAPSAPVASVPSAVTALLTYDPCQQQNAAAVALAQRALGQPVDSKYGTDTSTAARRLVPGAPAGCSPRPAWWAPPGQSNAPAAQTVPAAAPVAVSCPPGTALNPSTGACQPIPPQPAPPSGGGAPSPAPSGGGAGPSQPIVIAPEKPGISTGAIAAGAIGVVALVGVVAAASMGKGGKGAHGARGKSGARGHRGKAGSKHKGAAHKRATHRR
jgi:hypothetical protein